MGYSTPEGDDRCPYCDDPDCPAVEEIDCPDYELDNDEEEEDTEDFSVNDSTIY